MQTIIIGGGVIGLCSAYYLQQAGLDVTVIERNDLTDGCSFGNMGYVSPSHFVPLATPGIITQGLKWMMDSSSPFYIKPRLNLDLVRWGLTFWRKANARNVESNAPHLNNLLQLSRSLTTDLQRELHGDFDLVEKGVWMLWKAEKTGVHEKHLAEQAAAFGLRTLICTKQQVQDHEPEVEVDAAGGILYTDDAHLDPEKFMRSLHRHLLAAGVRFLLNTAVQGFEKAGGKITAVVTDKGRIGCDEVVMANGSWMGLLSKRLGIEILMQPGKGYSVAYSGLEKNLHYPSILVDDRTATTPIGRWLRIGGTMELSGHSETVLPKRMAAMHRAFGKYYPGMDLPKPDPSNTWFGYRPVTPDGVPYIGRHTKYANLTYAGGHAMLGVAAAAGTGKLVNDIVQRRPSTIDVSAFSPVRFG